jgi:hypothetical protein
VSDPGIRDLTNQYNTQLTPEQEAAFLKAYPNPKDWYDYDMRGAWLAGAGQAGNGHYPDTYKKPNHPTFSTGSQYSRGPQIGGTWSDLGNGKWAFQASPVNLQFMSPYELKDYFSRVEPGNELFLPGEGAFERTFKK